MSKPGASGTLEGLTRNVRESMVTVGLLAALFCVFFLAGFWAGRSAAKIDHQWRLPPVEQPVRVNLASR